MLHTIARGFRLVVIVLLRYLDEAVTELCRHAIAVTDNDSLPQPLQKEGGNNAPNTSTLCGRKEGAASVKFALMMAEYCLMEQIKTFGEALQSQYVDASEECQRYGANHSVFDQLAPTFTIDDLRALKRGYCSETAMRMIISRWMRDGWISKTDRHHWSKVKVNSEK